MKSIFIYGIISTIICFSCTDSSSFNPSQEEYKQIYINDNDSISTPTIKIHGLTLVTKNPKIESKEALEILKLKHQWPLAMQTKDRNLFDKILADNFTFRGESEFFTKNDYINNRVSGIWTIDTVTYNNLVLQFFGKTALLTYRNVLNGTDNSGIPDTEYYSWADIYTQVGDEWKILGSHNIEGRIVYKNK